MDRSDRLQLMIIDYAEQEIARILVHFNNPLRNYKLLCTMLTDCASTGAISMEQSRRLRLQADEAIHNALRSAPSSTGGHRG